MTCMNLCLLSVWGRENFATLCMNALSGRSIPRAILRRGFFASDCKGPTYF
jgi:hypothetical protein